MYKILHNSIEYLHGMAFHRMVVTSAIFFSLLFGILLLAPDVLGGAVLWIIVVLPIVGPVGMIPWLVNAWGKYVRSLYIAGINKTVLEVRIPSDIMKTPKAMEMVFRTVSAGSKETTFINRWWQGRVRAWTSYEFVSIEGELHFYIWCFDSPVNNIKHTIKNAIYAQYPNAEIFEVEDYASGLQYDNGKTFQVWTSQYKLAKPDAYPIKTYVDYGLDKDPSKMEQRVDPLSSIFELLSSLGPGEQLWIQFVTRLNKKNSGNPKWKEEAKAEIAKIKASIVETTLPDGSKVKGTASATAAQKEQLAALEKTLDQDGFDVGIRVLYMGTKEGFDKSRISPTIIHMWRTFRSGNLNSLGPRRGHAGMDYPWQDWKNIRWHKICNRAVEAYKRRMFFFAPFQRRSMVLTSEELATIYHYPTSETKAPGIMRIQSKKNSPPPNLPV